MTTIDELNVSYLRKYSVRFRFMLSFFIIFKTSKSEPHFVPLKYNDYGNIGDFSVA